MSYIERTIEKAILDAAKVSSVIMLTGARQAGKSTVLTHLFNKEKITYVTLDDIDDRELAMNDPKLFFRKYKNPMIIDEFQRAPKLLSQIKIIVDELKEKSLTDNNVKWQGQFFLTGSRLFETMKGITESLAGRVTILNLPSLTTREIDKIKTYGFIPESNQLNTIEKVKVRNLNELYNRIIIGGYPELYRVKESEAAKYYDDYLRTYIERDVRELINIKNESKFIKFMKNLSARTSNELNLTEVCNDIDITTTTAAEWLSILESSHLVYLLKPYYNNAIKRLTKRPKVYFFDTGLACYLTKHIYADELQDSMYSGQIFENYVVMEIIKEYMNLNLMSKFEFYYLKANETREIDLIIFDGHKYYPIEIKSNSKKDNSYIKHFKALNEASVTVGSGGVISLIDKIIPIDESNSFIPVEYI